ncbi:HD domain-containing protein [Flavihumibacter petaseus]|uniref:HD/PDEase domain-containing protein n=1 Tax=Flavihumibacter petaseus NBRC 106054 TaxID=1220578 RepID=A0A0E9MUQ8_9BACT|nr:HD domain-containing protein [Flavihumibacter petaseus]GAO41314.1 hypothetical protein FPE01S_01_03260 [Flavihumibacter petaseus NBRC 106054]
MTETGFHALKQHIIQRLSAGLDPRFTYHNLAHTLDVLEQASRIASLEGISDERNLLLLKIAALYHDTGFLFTYRGHEEKSCEILEEDLGDKGFSKEEMDCMKGMIMATKIPQSPATLMEEIICDADLDYLGRDDFEPISESLKAEFLAYGIIREVAEWDPIQVSFFEKHHYFTSSSIRLRDPVKQDHLARLYQRTE